ncbi:putative and nb-arc domain-containing protein [Eutypa lata UCREL1]|uniref:Putative and nb-arc domain-containing protein n=1 Tax=Eutypa lata (strain UCR-EL1) TaxID=1287681 RepID=M7SJU9_EUTLA|nr:putative and nb-arc domain-containing protein [Eutypa lata UCREL1]
MRGSINKQISRYEFTAVYTHPEAKVDIVLVHGLNGDPQKTWTAKNGTFWPADLLPASLRDAKANILVYGYNADVYSKKHGSNPSDNFIYLHAQTLVTSLTHYRKDEQTSHNPIIWRFKILMAHENHKTDIKGAKMLIVDSSSAGPQLPGVTYYAIEATHSGMCKFESRNAPGYRTVMILIREWVLDAADVIATRWRVEDEERLARAKHEIEERMKPWIQSQQIARHGHESSTELSDAGDLDRDEERGTRRMVVAVRAWLNSTSNWLLVLDGIHFDFPDLQYYIPFTKDSSMIFTSTEQTVAEAYQFDYPQIIALDSLAKEEAQELLLDEMGKKKPWTRDDLSQAAELVESMDRLPLMIHVAAQHLRATREPLAKYVRSFKNRPRVGNLPAYHEVRIQLQNRGAVVALNLMYMLSFFGQHIPVEMVALGKAYLLESRQCPFRTSDLQI